MWCWLLQCILQPAVLLLIFGALCVCCCLCVVVTVDLVAQQAHGQGDAVAPDVSKAVYALAAASGSDTAYDTLVSMYEQVRTPVSEAAWPKRLALQPC